MPGSLRSGQPIDGSRGALRGGKSRRQNDDEHHRSARTRTAAIRARADIENVVSAHSLRAYQLNSALKRATRAVMISVGVSQPGSPGPA